MIVGLTGGIGCGKSTVLNYFSQLRWQTFDADGLCRGLYEQRNPTLYRAIARRWGEKKVINQDGSADRKKIADIVFSDHQELQWLNAILHPLVYQVWQKKITRLETAVPAMFAVPLLFEAGWERCCQVTASVWAPHSIQYRRLQLNRGWSENEIARRARTQLTPEEKLEKADFGLINSGPKPLLYEQCDKLNQQIMRINK
jgi:dephospho-CoA kinase